MPQPTPWVRQEDFQVLSPGALGNGLENEFDAAKVTVDAILVNLALLQRDDGRIVNALVDRDALDSTIASGVRPPVTWTTATAFTVNDTVLINDAWYFALTSHTSGVFATDLANLDWELIFNFSEFQDALIISGLTAETAMANADVMVFFDDDALLNKKITVPNTAEELFKRKRGQNVLLNQIFGAR